jgi:type VI secretion system secreted protein VgrG
VSYTQENRTFRLDTNLGGECTLLESFEGREGISEPFHFALKFLAEKRIDMEALLGTAAVITTQKDYSDAKLYFHGYFWSIRQRADSEDGLSAYEAVLVPRLRFLELQVHCRIFHNSTVQDIISTVFADRALTNYRFDLQNTLPKRDYCVQYRETDLNFISRLLEEEGIYYYFQHAKDKHELVMSDKKAGVPVCPSGAKAQYHPIAGSLGISNPIFEFELLRQVHAGRIEINDYNYEAPKVSLSASLDSNKIGDLYDYPGGYKTKSDGDRYVRIRLEEEETRFSAVSGTGSCAGFRTGHSFQLGGHSQSDLNRQYLLVSIAHSGQNQSYRGDASAKAAKYHNKFSAIPACVQYRPPRSAAKAVVHGTQTAVVTGPEGQEIYTDQYGRIQVRFFWAASNSDSCWVRVAQTWAGKNWGAITIPRIGQEVVVDFLEGDPDRPLVIGSVYNADQMPPYDLPANKTRSGLRSHSSQGGSTSNCNEIYFDDSMGKEALFVQAERDNQIKVKHDRLKDIGNDETIKVGHDRATSISNNDSLTVGADRSESIGKNDSLSVGSDRSANVGNNDSLQVGAKLSVVAGEQIQFTAPGGSITIGPSGITIQSGMTVVIQGAMVQIN